MKTYYDYITDAHVTTVLSERADSSRLWVFLTNPHIYVERFGFSIRGTALDHTISTLPERVRLRPQNSLHINLKLKKIVSAIPDHIFKDNPIKNKLAIRRTLAMQRYAHQIFREDTGFWDPEVIKSLARMAGVKNPAVGAYDAINGRYILNWSDDDPIVEANWIFLKCVEIAIAQLGNGSERTRNQLNVKIRDTYFTKFDENMRGPGAWEWLRGYAAGRYEL